ncbi:hypothetical protein [Saccharopolyspora spinosa]|uniref:Uncharacterized protein n=2 Tax=Saccharopolyspora spinosa TaxID=60894 RepID=A0A2N3Y110_SACSN|nr:hypothetical protein [Saccharopolyspora spinosa]PKW16599.1 hypothetical protein A8926_4444 [Saccharopolyspora spinosa]
MMTIRKLAATTLLTLGLAGGIAATQGVASAATFVPAGVYSSSSACAKAGNAGFPQHRWVGWRCENLHNGRYLLWVQPRY